jgi:peptidoglycan/LPS O-acetylase OafA/YrhL
VIGDIGNMLDMNKLNSISTNNQLAAKVKRIDFIDFLRGLSIVAVILLHINVRIPFQNSFIGQHLSPSVSLILFWSGYYGVIVFFVISGFLITTSSIKRWGNLKNIRYDQFYLIRFARIMPCLIGLLLILSILDIAGVKDFVIDREYTSLGHAIFSALTFHLNWLEAKTGYLPGAWNVLWSLSVEEVFYFFFPLICRWVKSELNFTLLMFSFIVTGPFARIVFTSNDIWMDHSYLSCMDGIAFGCLAALLINKIRLPKRYLRALMIAGILLTLFVVVFRKTVYSLGLSSTGLNVTVLEIGISLLIIALYNKSINNAYYKNWVIMVFRWFGRNCYEIYLTHNFFIVILSQAFYATHLSFNLAPVWYLVIIGVSGICGQLISDYYSEPINKILRTKFLTYPEHSTNQELVSMITNAEK